MGRRSRMPGLIVLLVLVAVLAACQPPAGPEAEAEGPAETSAEHMQKHFDEAAFIQQAVIGGDLGGLRERARWMAEHIDTAEVPGELNDHVSQLQEAALGLADSPDLEAASAALGAMGRACGGCHEAAAVALTFTPPPPPDEGTTVVEHMCQHEWAAERMWEGLIGPSNESWNDGVRSLMQAALAPEELSGEDELFGQVQALSQRVHDLGVEGVKAEGARSRSKIYGEFVATCSRCHELMSSPEQPEEEA